MTSTNVAPSTDLAASTADANRALSDALVERDRLRDLSDAADEAARLAEVAALNAEKVRVVGELRDARDAAEKRYATVVRNPKATLVQLAQAHLDRCEAGAVIETERRAINARLDDVDPQYQAVPVYPGARDRETRFVPRETSSAGSGGGNPLYGFPDVIVEWATNVTANTVVDDAARDREARVIAARHAAREAVLAGVTASS